ncbi:MAG: helical backbone metal receptor, partial [Planctomycetota bacterium]
MRALVVAAAALAAGAAGCGRAAPEPERPARLVRDGRGKLVRVPEPLRRIVSIAPSATELLFAAGAGDLLVGATRYCDWPPEARAVPRVGDIVIDYERLASLRPDLVVTAYSITRGTTAELEAKGYGVFAVDPDTFEEIGEALRALGDLAGRSESGRRAAEALLERVRSVRPADPPGPTFYFEHSADPLGGAGPETYVGDALRRAGGRNVLEGGWRQV